MMPILFRIILFLPLGLLAQKGGVSNTTLSVQNNAVSVNGSDSLIQDSAKQIIEVLSPVEKYYREHAEFGVYTKPATSQYKRARLYIQLAENGKTHLFSIHDSLCINPEKSKVLFQKMEGDSVFSLIAIDAFSKATDNPLCDAGKETKVVYARWSTKNNKSKFKQRTVSSCLRGITNLTATDLFKWNPDSGPLELNYHKGGDLYIQVIFNPKDLHIGFQSTSE